ncbi:hypothetical protein [Streptomyces sp. NPDC058157]|uniref:hypothetical protein n=1 Tax=Streptomyces sp. NPDC058157 TaxID=3346360 RepID=UPI0036E24CC1
MDLIEFTHAVTRAGAGFGFFLVVVTAAAVFYSQGRTFKALKKKRFVLPWVSSFAVMVLASAVSGGYLGKVSAGFTGTSNRVGSEVGNTAIGQSGEGAVEIHVTEVLSYSGSWIALCAIVVWLLFLWFAKGWGERALALSGALSGASWGIATSLGGVAAMIGVPLVSWLGEQVIG